MAIPEELKPILQACYLDVAKHGPYFFPDTFYAPINTMHLQILELIASGHKKIAIAAPRGLGKTSWMNIGLATHHIMYRVASFILYISKNGDNAIAQTENLKRELITNKRVRKLFGNIKTGNVNSAEDLGLDLEFEDSFSKKVWTAFDSLILPRGRGQQVRGLLYKSKRPDFILIDDLEDADMMESELYRQKLKQWFYADVVKCVSRFDKNFQFIYIDTLKHEDSLLQELLDSPDWASVRIEACDDDLNPTDPIYMDKAELQEEFDSHERNGQLDVFYREFRNLPISTADPVFSPDNFKRVRDNGDEWLVVKPDPMIKNSFIIDKSYEPIRKKDLYMVVIVDPAKTVKLHSADSACVAVGIHRKDQRIIVCEVRAEKYHPDELIDNAFEMVRYHNARILAVEVTSLHEWISQPIENEMRVQSIFAQYVELNAVGKKAERVAGLAPFYKRGYVYHAMGHEKKLEAQLTMFPRPKLWDTADAFAYVVKLMDNLSIYFDPADDYDDDPEGEFDELENDDSYHGELLS